MAEPRPETRTLPSVLTQAEISDRAQRSSKLLGDLEEARLREKDAERAKKRAADQLPETDALASVRSECERIEEEARRLARVAREGKEDRRVECEWRDDGAREICVRLDTGEIVDSRALSAARRQQEIPFVDEAPAPAPAASDDGTTPPWADGKGSGGAPN